MPGSDTNVLDSQLQLPHMPALPPLQIKPFATPNPNAMELSHPCSIMLGACYLAHPNGLTCHLTQHYEQGLDNSMVDDQSDNQQDNAQ